MTRFFLRAQLSVALKTPSTADFGDFGRIYGSGFNAELEAGWTWTNAIEAEIEPLFLDLVKKFDHRHLGFDAPDLGITTPESLLKYCFQFLHTGGFPPTILRLRRGEGIVYELEGKA